MPLMTPYTSPYQSTTTRKPPAMPQWGQAGAGYLGTSNPMGPNYQTSAMPKTGSSYTPPPQDNFVLGGNLAGGAMGSSFTPAPTQYAAPGMPQAGSSYAPPTSYQAPQMPETGSSFASPPSPAPGLNLPYGTRDNLSGYGSGWTEQYSIPEFQNPNFAGQVGPYKAPEFSVAEYFNSPGFNFQLDQGLGAVESRQAARGLLNSSGTQKDMEDYRQGLASTYMNDAFSRFNTDRNFGRSAYENDMGTAIGRDLNSYDQFADRRNFGQKAFMDRRNFAAADNAAAFGQFKSDINTMSDNYWNTNAANTADVWNTNNMNWDITKYGNQDFQNRLMDWYNQMNGISNTGLNAAGNTGTIQGNLGAALAGLFGNQGNVGAAQAVQQGNNNSQALQGLLSLIGML